MEATLETEIYTDVERLYAEVDTLDTQPAEVVTQKPEEKWEDACEMLVGMLNESVLFKSQPMGGLEREKSIAALAAVLNRYLPGAFAGFDNWHPLLQLAGVSGFLAFNRRQRLIAWAGRNKDHSGDLNDDTNRRHDDAGDRGEPQRKDSGLDPAD